LPLSTKRVTHESVPARSYLAQFQRQIRFIHLFTCPE